METLVYKPVSKDRLFYDQYQYSLGFYLQHAGLMRGLDSAMLDHRIQWRSEASWVRTKVEDHQREKLHQACDWLRTAQDRCKILFYSNWVYIYTDDQSWLEQTAQQSWVSKPTASQAVVNRPRDTVLLKNPQYLYRSYFRDKTLTNEQRQSLCKFLLSRSDCFGYTPNLESRLQNKYFYSMSHYYVDHNDMKDLVLLSLVLPGLIRKTLSIQAK